ncbi:hypothetical protein [Deinococcus sp.]|uniref:hypothetical protein n=1 Tax=Deinococcus sp. TaxID=47478 RepID=UPI003CC693BD
MKNVLPLLFSALLMSSFNAAAGTAQPPLVFATLQDNTSTLIKQAAALLTAGHPAQAGFLYLRAGDAAAAAQQSDTAAAAYQKAAAAFHLANDPSSEATADERLADVYLKQAGVTPAAGKPATPAPTPAAQVPVRPAAQNAPAHPAVPKVGDAGAISGPPVINPAFGARMPRKCKPVTHVPTETEAAALAQCATENGGEPGAFDPLIYLWQNVRVQMGKSRPYAYNADSHSTSIDTEARVYPIRVTGDQLSCTGKPTCMTRHADNAEGTCYKTTFGDWQCYFSQVFGVTKSSVELPVPKTY